MTFASVAKDGWVLNYLVAEIGIVVILCYQARLSVSKKGGKKKLGGKEGEGDM